VNEPSFWESVNFQDRMTAWIDRERPDLDLIGTVVDWVKDLIENPYLANATRQTDIASNLWWARIPGTFRNGSDVMCAYWIDEEMRRIRCDSFATLNRPN
jgi:hypothetical protein